MTIASYKDFETYMFQNIVKLSKVAYSVEMDLNWLSVDIMEFNEKTDKIHRKTAALRAICATIGRNILRPGTVETYIKSNKPIIRDTILTWNNNVASGVIISEGEIWNERTILEIKKKFMFPL